MKLVHKSKPKLNAENAEIKTQRNAERIEFYSALLCVLISVSSVVEIKFVENNQLLFPQASVY